MGALLYGSRKIVRKLCASCVLREQTRSSRATNPRPSGLVALGLAENRQGYVRGVALSREPLKLQQAYPLLAT